MASDMKKVRLKINGKHLPQFPPHVAKVFSFLDNLDYGIAYSTLELSKRLGFKHIKSVRSSISHYKASESILPLYRYNINSSFAVWANKKTIEGLKNGKITL